GDFRRFARYAERMLEEREFFIRKSIGWVLRETGKPQPDTVFAWLLPRAARASGVTVREAVKYLSSAQRLRCSLPINRPSTREELPAADLDKGGEQRIQMGVGARLGLVVIAGRELPDPVHHHPGGGHAVDDGFEAVAELDGRRDQLLAAQCPGHSPLVRVGHRLVLEIGDLRPPAPILVAAVESKRRRVHGR